MQELFITSAQIKAARALLNWSQEDLAEACNISIQTIKRIEANDAMQTVKIPTLQKILIALNDQGIIFSVSENEVSVTHKK